MNRTLSQARKDRDTSIMLNQLMNGDWLIIVEVKNLDWLNEECFLIEGRWGEGKKEKVSTWRSEDKDSFFAFCLSTPRLVCFCTAQSRVEKISTESSTIARFWSNRLLKRVSNQRDLTGTSCCTGSLNLSEGEPTPTDSIKMPNESDDYCTYTRISSQARPGRLLVPLFSLAS